MIVPVVTIIVPTRDEVADIEGCLESIAAQDHPVNRMEVIVVDGCSSDGTADLARRQLGRWGFASSAVLANEGLTASSNLNLGLSHATGEIVCRVDARTRIEPHYVRTCVEVLTAHPEIAVVGGAQAAIARDATARAIGIARALNNRWSMGGSPYRRSTTSGVSDTVYLGAFRRDDLERVGGWDERLASNQDFDLNRRMSRLGQVWFEASLRSGYVPRRTFPELWRQYLRFGRAKVVYWRTAGDRPNARQRLLLALPAVSVPLGLAALRSSRTRLPAVVVAVASLAVVESTGSEAPGGGPAAHALSAVAMTVVAGAWLSGVAREAVHRSG
ncbi:MAG: glycosyltransferase [Acidimicrobiales bacterium]